MPPKSKITKKAIIGAALEIVRREGADALNARSLAAELGCSTQPIFSNYASMAELTSDVLAGANELYEKRISEALGSSDIPPYKAVGLAYIRFAEEERELFRMLFMRDRTGEVIGEDRESIRPILELLEKNLSISEDDAYLFHLELWLSVHGIATMLATSYLKWDESFISRALSDAYEGLKLRYAERRELWKP